MKKSVVFVVVLLLICGIVAVVGVHSEDTSEYLRIHIRANSNTEVDQDIKYVIKGKVVELLSPKLEGVKTADEAKNIVKSNINAIDGVANSVLEANNLPYRAKTSLRREHFPTRHYGNVTLDAGEYEALIVELGRAEGNNWWCVVFPPLCFVKSEEIGSGDFRYVSKIGEWIEKIRGGRG